MNTIFMTTKNSGTSESHKFRLNLSNKINLKQPHRYISLANLSIYYTWKNVTKKHNNGKFKITAPSWSEEFELPEGSYNVSDINEYFQFIVKKHTKDHDKDIEIYANKVKNRVAFKLGAGVSLEFMSPETQKFLGFSVNKVTGTGNGDKVPQLETVQTVLVHCNLVDNDYQRDSMILYSFVPDKSFGNILSIQPSDFIWLKTFNSEFNYIEVWFSDQDSVPLEIEDNVQVTIVIR